VTQSTSSTSARRPGVSAVATPKRARVRPGSKQRGAAAALLTQGSPRTGKENSPATGSTAPAPPSQSEDSVVLPSTQSVDSRTSEAQAQRFHQHGLSKPLCCGDGCFGGFNHLLRSGGSSSSTDREPLQLPVGRSLQERDEPERRRRLAELSRRFAAAQQAAKGLQLSTEHKLQLYAYQKQAIEGPAFGAAPSAFNVAARSKWDAWAKLKCMDKDIAKQGYCALVDKLAPGWRSRAGF